MRLIHVILRARAKSVFITRGWSIVINHDSTKVLKKIIRISQIRMIIFN